MIQRFAFRLANKAMLISAIALGVIVLLVALFARSWAAAAPGFLLVGFGLGMWFNGIEQRNADQKATDDASPSNGSWRLSSN
jgi:predicted phage tail protein